MTLESSHQENIISDSEKQYILVHTLGQVASSISESLAPGKKRSLSDKVKDIIKLDKDYQNTTDPDTVLATQLGIYFADFLPASWFKLNKAGPYWGSLSEMYNQIGKYSKDYEKGNEIRLPDEYIEYGLLYPNPIVTFAVYQGQKLNPDQLALLLAKVDVESLLNFETMRHENGLDTYLSEKGGTIAPIMDPGMIMKSQMKLGVTLEEFDAALVRANEIRQEILNQPEKSNPPVDIEQKIFTQLVQAGKKLHGESFETTFGQVVSKRDFLGWYINHHAPQDSPAK